MVYEKERLSFEETILHLIALHQEGGYWDFKREWYAERAKTDLLHDIICMANNLYNRDAYIIIGVDEENDYAIVEWIGKDKVVNHHLDVPYRVLERKYSYDEAGRHDEDNGSENMIIHGDNLDALKALLPRYEGRVKCIYIDPPYNTGNEGWVYNDNVNDPRIKKWLGEVVGKEGEDLSRHDKWLCMMYPQLKLLHRLLSEDGVIVSEFNKCAYDISHISRLPRSGERNGDQNVIVNANIICVYYIFISIDDIELSYEQKRIVFKDGDKHGTKDFDGNITKRRAIYFIRCWMCATASAGRQT